MKAEDRLLALKAGICGIYEETGKWCLRYSPSKRLFFTDMTCNPCKINKPHIGKISKPAKTA